MYKEASSWMNVKEQMFEIDVTDVEDNAESSWMLRKERSFREMQAQQGRWTAGPITGCSDQRLLKNIISRILAWESYTIIGSNILTYHYPSPAAKAASGIGTVVSVSSTRAFVSPWLFLAWHS